MTSPEKPADDKNLPSSEFEPAPWFEDDPVELPEEKAETPLAGDTSVEEAPEPQSEPIPEPAPESPSDEADQEVLEEEYLTVHDPAFYPKSWYRRRKVRRYVGLGCRLALVLFLLFPLIDFLRVSIGRMYYDFEVEWLEGEVAVYAVRWQAKPSLDFLYPEYQSSDYTPHLYAPLYQIVVAELHSLFGGELLGLGRLVSLISTIALMLAVLFAVRDASGSWFGGIAGGLSYLMFFKVSGYWYDLMRVDSFAYALAMWSAYLLTRWRGGFFSVGLGLVLAFLAQFAKQTAVFIPILALAIRLSLSVIQLVSIGLKNRSWRIFPRGSSVYTHPIIPFVLMAVVITFAVNLAYFVSQGAWGNTGFYLYEVGKSHNIFYDSIRKMGQQFLWQYYSYLVWLPALGLWMYPLLRRWKSPLDTVVGVLCGIAGCTIGAYVLSLIIAYGNSLNPGALTSFVSLEAIALVISTWTAPMRWAAAMMIGGLVLAAVRWVFYRTPMRGIWLIGLLFVSQHVAAVTWVKIGGYINNYMPLFAVQSVVIGLAVAWIYKSLERSLGGAGSILGIVIVLPLFWVSWAGTRHSFLVENPAMRYADRPVEKMSTEEYQMLSPWVTDGLQYNRGAYRIRDEVAERAGINRPDPEKEGYNLIRSAAPLGRQVPTKESEEWGHKLLGRLKELDEEGRVYLPHQNYLGHMAGIGIRNSVDSIRDVRYMGKSSPTPLVNALRKKSFDYIVLMSQAEYDWLPTDVRRLIQSNYKLEGSLMPGAPWNAYRPTTGAEVRPEWIYVPKD